MKKILIILFYLSINSYAQSLKISYVEKKILTKEKLEQIPDFAKENLLKELNYTLNYINGKSLYTNNEKNQDTQNNTTNENKIDSLDIVEIKEISTRYEDKSIEKYYYKDLEANEILFEFFNGSKKVYGKDVFQNWNWEITNETKNISGFNCKKAVSNFQGYEFTAWFTEEIPINAGPEKFDGLPGLILFVGTQHYEWKATKIMEILDKKTIKKPDFDKKQTATLIEIFCVIKSDMNSRKSSETITQEGNTTTRKRTIIIK